ncbi:MetQ/NlpA family ABC transporter substrate-binding protein [Corynebacterium diphtheriae]|uniref:MetQ/NlpA family ABC transporter substrate-binding protein n=1 Tax=Corynebacterium diphtheriae TaxID=1717 RepID=UPI0002467FA6|nr:MetQ/NlpA family ABC transporter substrate-binding protein [Corynebacterium diphtheriae]OWN41337.1 methionine ABC transporter substrate-binding protein [Corynebacterium belfantii]AEX71557.1 D-methionine-binding lipoprotein [Corynebacterium diphtheriae CDCE 8392]APM36943.1 methionine ABC transporter substrate-binding protein [Corynebacterium diphtheriae]AWR15286.1 D-methionine-binding lipoprotein [Corynebacterium diphtheriae]MBG9221053.1 methionine ABC transporter substrate-binding protein [
MKLRRSVALVSASLIAATGLVACSNSSDSSDQATVKIGTTDGSKKSWKVFEDKAKEAGIKLDIKNFSDYSTPNDALAQDQLDVNLFQHLKFLAEYNVGKNADLTPVGATEIVPLALFWKDHTSLDGIEGKSVAIPNDPSNQGRAINVLVQAKLITLKKEGLITPTPSDVDEAKSKVKLTPVDAAQTTTAYGEGTPAIINNSFLDRAGIDPKLSVFQDDPNSTEAEPYINAFVTKAEDKDDANIAKLVEIWHSKEVQDAVAEDSKGTSVPVQRTAEELKKILDRLEADQKK